MVPWLRGLYQHWRPCYWIFRLYWAKWLSQNYYRMYLEKKGLGGLQSLLIVKMGTRMFDFQLNELLLKFLGQIILCDVFWSKDWKNNTLWQQHSFLRPGHCGAYDKGAKVGLESLALLLQLLYTERNILLYTLYWITKIWGLFQQTSL